MLHIDYRPETFEQFIGNGAIVKSLQSKLDKKQLPHSLLFHGPSGCGKTTLGRILKGQLGCSDNDFIEINAGNNRGIETAREIIRNITMRPMVGDVRIYLLDECHQGTKDFQNSLLKPLEDTPSYAYFILCTTDPQKLLKTIRNRCTSYEVQQLRDEEVEELLEYVMDEEGKNISDDAFFAILDRAEGCPRQALVLLDQVIDLSPDAQAAAVQAYKSQEEQAFELAKQLFAGATWARIQPLLQSIENEEGARRMVLKYITTVGMNERNSQKVAHAATIYRAFRLPFYDTGKAGLVYAAWEAGLDRDIPY